MNFTQKFFLLILLSFNAGLFSQEVPRLPLRKSGAVAIPIEILEKAQARSFESELSSNQSSEASPSKSTSPARREIDEINDTDVIFQELHDLFDSQKQSKSIFTRIQAYKSDEGKKQELYEQLEKLLEEKLAIIKWKKRIPKIQKEEAHALENVFFEFPGIGAKVCSFEELKAAEMAAYKSLLDCP